MGAGLGSTPFAPACLAPACDPPNLPPAPPPLCPRLATMPHAQAKLEAATKAGYRSVDEGEAAEKAAAEKATEEEKAAAVKTAVQAAVEQVSKVLRLLSAHSRWLSGRSNDRYL